MATVYRINHEALMGIIVPLEDPKGYVVHQRTSNVLKVHFMGDSSARIGLITCSNTTNDANLPHSSQRDGNAVIHSLGWYPCDI